MLLVGDSDIEQVRTGGIDHLLDRTAKIRFQGDASTLPAESSGDRDEVGITFFRPKFRALCAASILILLWCGYQFRVRQLAHQFNIRLEERVSERTRIARDLHDTLLQSFQGLVFRFQAARYHLPDRPEEASDALDSALVSADQAIAEGRGAIQALRSESSEESNLEQMLLATGRRTGVLTEGW